jgi:GNAT superfamily N-acetyltransferase
MIDIHRCTIAEIEAAPNLAEVLAEYARESSIQEMGPASAQFETYRALEATGMFHPIGAFENGRLVGFIFPIVVVLPHYGVLAATVESFFVPQADRKKGIGLFLIHQAEVLAKGLGAKALLFSAPAGGSLAQVLPGRGYRHSNNVFVKGMA